MMAPEARKTNYVIRGGAEGRERLRLLSQIHRQSTLDLLQRAGVAPGMACLDVGCGGGDVCFELARLVAPDGSVLGVDIDAVKIDIAQREARAQQLENVAFRVIDLEQGELPSQFDFVHIRFVLSHLRNPQKLLATIHGALRPGGTIVVADTQFYGFFSEPESRALARGVELYVKTIERRGANANIGPRLPSMLAAAGFQDVQVGVVQHAHIRGEPKTILPLTVDFSADAIITEGLASRAEMEALVAEMYEFAENPMSIIAGPRIIQAWAKAAS